MGLIVAQTAEVTAAVVTLTVAVAHELSVAVSLCRFGAPIQAQTTEATKPAVPLSYGIAKELTLTAKNRVENP